MGKKGFFSGLFSKSKGSEDSGTSQATGAEAKPEAETSSKKDDEAAKAEASPASATKSAEPGPSSSGQKKGKKRFVDFNQLLTGPAEPPKENKPPSPAAPPKKANLLALSAKAPEKKSEPPKPGEAKVKPKRVTEDNATKSNNDPKPEDPRPGDEVHEPSKQVPPSDGNAGLGRPPESGRGSAPDPGSAVPSTLLDKDRAVIDDAAGVQAGCNNQVSGAGIVQGDDSRPEVRPGQSQVPQTQVKDTLKPVADADKESKSEPDLRRAAAMNNPKDGKPEQKKDAGKKRGWFGSMFHKKTVSEPDLKEAEKSDEPEVRPEDPPKKEETPEPISGANTEPDNKATEKEPDKEPYTEPEKEVQNDVPDSPKQTDEPVPPAVVTTPDATPSPDIASRRLGDRNKEPMEEHHLRAIWKALNVGEDGYLTLPELSTVCQHIGMKSMTDKELKVLFSDLDSNNDERVSFNEFMNGLKKHSPKDVKPPSKPVPLGLDISMFSSIDHTDSGYAKPSEIVDYWRRIGVPDGSSLLKRLNFDPKSSTINLADLSQALGAHLLQSDQNSLQYAAALSCAHEIKNLKYIGGQIERERDTYRRDLIDANSQLANDVRRNRDDPKEIQSVEEKYEEEIRRLRRKMEDLKDIHATELSEQRRTMENVIIRLKEEETLLREKVADLTFELGRLEHEATHYKERVAHFENISTAQQKELDSLADLHAKMMLELASLSNTEELRDANDELIMEVEMLRHHMTSSQARGSKLKERLKNDEPGRIITDNRRQEQPEEPFPDYYEFNVLEKLKKDFEFLRNKYVNETADLRDKLETARADYELELKDELADMEDQYERKLNNLRHQFQQEKENLHVDNEKRKVDVEGTIRQEMEQRHKCEKETLAARFEADKLAIEKKHETDKHEVVKQLERDYQEELRRRMEGMKEAFEKERNEKNNYMSRMADDWESQKRAMKDELAQDYTKELQLMRERFASDKARLEELHRLEIRDYEDMLAKGEHALRGKLREDFDALLARGRDQIRAEESAKLMANFMEEKTHAQELHDADMQRFSQLFTDEKREIIAEYERRIARYQAEAELIPNSLVEEFDRKLENAKLTFQSELDRLQEENRILEDQLSDQDINRTVCEQYKKRYEDQLARTKELEGEASRSNEIAILEKSLSEMKTKFDLRLGDIAEKVEEIDELKIKNDQLMREKDRMEKNLMDMEDSLNTKDEVISNLKNKVISLETSERESSTSASMLQSRLKEAESKLKYSQDQLRDLKLEMQMQKDNLTAKINKLMAENEELRDKLREKEQINRQLESELSDQKNDTQLRQKTLNSEKNRMKDQLQQEQNRIVAMAQENNVLRRHLQNAEGQISQLTDQLAESEKEHLRDLEEARDRLADYVDVKLYNDANDRLLAAEKKIKELETLLQKSLTGKDEALQETKKNLTAALREAETANEATKKKLDITKEMLKEKVDLLKKENEENRRASRMAENLFKENAQLMRALQFAEDQMKKTDQRNTELEQKCSALQRCLKKVVKDEADLSFN